MGSATFQKQLILEDIYLDIPVLDVIKDRFYGTYKRIPEYHRQGTENSKRGVPNYSMMGHPYFSKFFNQMNNLANQASGTSEVAKMFFRLADEVGLLSSETIDLAVQIHDSNLFYYWGLADYIEQYAYAIGILAQKAWWTCLQIGYALGTSKYNDIPMPVEVGVADVWKEVDDKIMVNLIGREYMDNREAMDKWLLDFTALHQQNVRSKYANVGF